MGGFRWILPIYDIPFEKRIRCYGFAHGDTLAQSAEDLSKLTQASAEIRSDRITPTQLVGLNKA